MLFRLLKQKCDFGRNLLVCINWLILFCALASSQKLPFKSFTIADGLPNNQIRQIYQDKKGYIWLATNEGLSRFDGYNFTNFDDRDGLGSKRVNDVLEDSQGRLWIANNDNGISVKVIQNFDSKDDKNSNQKFKTFSVGETNQSNSVNRILIDSNKFLWCLTDDGLFRTEISDEPEFELIYAYKSPINFKSRTLFQGKDGHLWFAVNRELFEVVDGKVIAYAEMPFTPDLGISNGFQDKAERLLFVANENGPFEFIRPSDVQTKPQWRKLLTDTKNTTNFRFIFQDDSKRIWFAGWGGLFKFADETLQKAEFQDFNALDAISMMQDREGNFWIGMSKGLNLISDESLISFTKIEDVEFPQIKWLTEEKDGTFRVGFIDVRQKYINKFRKAEIKDNQIKISNFDQFITSDDGNYLVHWQTRWSWKDGVDFPVSHPVFQLKSGKEIDAEKYLEKPLTNESYMSFYEDEKGFLWFVKNDEFLHRADPDVFPLIKTEKFPCELSEKDGNAKMMTDFNGGIWLFASVIKRFRNNHCEILDDERLNKAHATKGFHDSRGWFWIATENNGVAVTQNQTADQPFFKFYNENDGLTNRTVHCITEDKQGRMYFGTSHGLSRFDPQSGQWKTFTSKNGLPNDEIYKFYNDSAGNIWIMTIQGLAKLNPNVERKSFIPPSVYINRVNIPGKNLVLFEEEIDKNPLIELEAQENNLTIDFVGLEFKNQDALTYQYKLDGINQDWSKPSKNRSVTFANLVSGNYRFQVRAINEDGLVSDTPANFQFKIYPPIYLRWWFISLVILLVAAIIYAFYRLRLQKLLEIERTRTLIATDLHDDIGSNLSKISVLSEVVRLQLERDGKSDEKLLSSIAEISRESVGSMSDIVWAINPERDSVLEMIRKMRQHAEEIFVPKGISIDFPDSGGNSKIKLQMDLRRDLYLVFKETVNNIVKHSECSKVKINFTVNSQEIILQIEDNGIGFDIAEAVNGNGLSSMQKRIERLKGTLQIESELELGTKIIIRIPQN